MMIGWKRERQHHPLPAFGGKTAAELEKKASLLS